MKTQINCKGVACYVPTIVTASLLLALAFTVSCDNGGGSTGGVPSCLGTFRGLTACEQGADVTEEDCDEEDGTFGDGCPTTGITQRCDNWFNTGSTVIFYSDMNGGTCEDPFVGLTPNSCEVDFGAMGSICAQHAALDQAGCDEMGEMGEEKFPTHFSEGTSCPAGGVECKMESEVGVEMSMFMYGLLASRGCDIF